NAHPHQRAAELFTLCDQVIVVTCGPAGPQVSQATSRVWQERLLVLVQRTTDHLFNLEMQPEIVILTPGWELHGSAEVLLAEGPVWVEPWQAAILVQPARLHILEPGTFKRVETVDFEG